MGVNQFGEGTDVQGSSGLKSGTFEQGEVQKVYRVVGVFFCEFDGGDSGIEVVNSSAMARCCLCVLLEL